MSDRAAKRIQKELAAMLDDPPPGCSIVQMGDDLFRWQVEVQGPPDSPYEGATFTLLVTFPTTYPFKPPKVQFETRIYHPNINQRGDICLDTLSTKWVPSISMAQVMLSITLLLSDPNPSDPINMQAARVLRNNPEEYNRMVRTMVGRQSRGGQRQARNEEGVAGPDIGDEDAREGAEQEEEVLNEVEAGAAGRGEADAEVNAVDEEEVVADPADAEADHDGELDNEEEAAAVEVAGGVDPAADKENAEEDA